MALIQLQQIQFNDKNMQLFQGNVQKAISDIQQNPFQGGNLLTGISLLSASATQVKHLLNRVPSIWLLCDQQSNSVVWRTSWDSTFITLACSANCTVSLWVN